MHIYVLRIYFTQLTFPHILFCLPLFLFISVIHFMQVTFAIFLIIFFSIIIFDFYKNAYTLQHLI